MATTAITTPPVGPSSAALVPGTTTVTSLSIPELGFEVKDIKDVTAVAGKVNGAAQYVFEVAFHPSGNPGDTKVFTAKVPLHAPTLKEALIMLHVFAKNLDRTKTESEFKDMMDKLKYSAVSFESTDQGEYKISFSSYNEVSSSFKEAHIKDFRVSVSMQKTLEKIAEPLAQKYSNLFPTPAAHAQASLHQTSSSTAIDLSVTSSATLASRWEEHKKVLTKHLGKDTTSPAPTSVELEACKKFIDEVFGSTANEFSKILNQVDPLRSNADEVIKDLCIESQGKIFDYTRTPGFDFINSDAIPSGRDLDAFSTGVEWMIKHKNKAAASTAAAPVVVAPAAAFDSSRDPAKAALKTAWEGHKKALIGLRDSGAVITLQQLKDNGIQAFLDGLLELSPRFALLPGNGFTDVAIKTANPPKDSASIILRMCKMSNTIISNYCDANSKPNPAINGNDIETLSKLVEWMIDNKLAVTS